MYLIIAKPITPSEVVLACLQVSMITKSRAITYVDSKPPALKTKIVTSSCTLGFHLVNGYTSRPGEFEDITFTEYFIKYETDRMTRRSTTPIIKDNLGYYVYRNKKITRFTYFHPTYNQEEFFFNIMLQNICFRNEKELLSDHNTKQSYVYECHIRGFFPNLDIFQDLKKIYAHRNLIETEKRTQLLENLLEEHPYLDSKYVLPDTIQ
jgi:hypothetical protein